MTDYDIIATIAAILAGLDLLLITYDMYVRHSKKTPIIFSLIFEFIISILWFSKLFWDSKIISIIMGIAYLILSILKIFLLYDLCHSKNHDKM